MHAEAGTSLDILQFSGWQWSGHCPSSGEGPSCRNALERPCLGACWGRIQAASMLRLDAQPQGFRSRLRRASLVWPSLFLTDTYRLRR